MKIHVMHQTWKKKIESLAGQLLHKNKLLKLPINVNKLAKCLDLKIIEHQFEGNVSGVLTIKENKGTIGVNVTQSQVRMRFTIAHEIGHYVLEHQRLGKLFVDKNTSEFTVKLFRNSDSAKGEIQQEREANAFAAAILMPSTLVKRESRNYSFDLTDDENSDLEKLAKDFNVSVQAMAFRLSNLGYVSM